LHRLFSVRVIGKKNVPFNRSPRERWEEKEGSVRGRNKGGKTSPSMWTGKKGSLSLLPERRGEKEEGEKSKTKKEERKGVDDLTAGGRRGFLLLVKR